MEIILLEDISKLGKLGDKVKVKPGFGRNYLIPQKKGLPPTKDNIKYFEERRAQLEAEAKLRLQEARARAITFEGLKITIAANAGEEGKLFGSVAAHDIVEAFKEQGHDIAKSEVRLPEGPLRQVGEYELELHFMGNEVSAKYTLVITAE